MDCWECCASPRRCAPTDSLAHVPTCGQIAVAVATPALRGRRYDRCGCLCAGNGGVAAAVDRAAVPPLPPRFFTLRPYSAAAWRGRGRILAGVLRRWLWCMVPRLTPVPLVEPERLPTASTTDIDAPGAHREPLSSSALRGRRRWWPPAVCSGVDTAPGAVASSSKLRLRRAGDVNGRSMGAMCAVEDSKAAVLLDDPAFLEREA